MFSVIFFWIIASIIFSVEAVVGLVHPNVFQYCFKFILREVFVEGGAERHFLRLFACVSFSTSFSATYHDIFAEQSTCAEGLIPLQGRNSVTP